MSAPTVENGAPADVVASNDVPATSTEGTAVNDSKSVDTAAAVSAAEGRRLYIGNLAYTASEDDIRTFFAGFKIEAVTIPKNPRTDKAVGYAFVDLESADDSERAINELAGKEVLERKVSVQLAHKPDQAPEKDGETAKRSSRSSRSRGRNRGAKKDAGDAAAGHDANGSAAPATAAPAEGAAQSHHKRGSTSNAHAQQQKRERGPPTDGVASKNKVMVANLPYDLSEEKLKELFAAYDPVSAKIALRPIPRFMIKKLEARNEPRKGRGFGFVTFASEEIQQKAVAEMNAQVVEGREIAVKVAIDSPDKTDEALAAKANALSLDEKDGASGAKAEATGADASEASAPVKEVPASAD